MRVFIVLFGLLLLSSCGEDTVVKPRALLALEYPNGEYKKLETDCPYTFLKNTRAQIKKQNGCGFTIYYPKMKASVFITYQEVRDSNLTGLLYDAQKLAYGHIGKANSIPEQPFVNPDKNSYGMLYMINGNAASQSQFYITDSIKHFVTGALYFEAKPNFDSIYPAVMYLRNDMRTMMETIEWKE